MRVAADVAEDGVHAGQLDARADDRVVLVGHRVEVGHAPALLQDLVVRGSEQAVREAVPAEKEEFWSLSLVSITLRRVNKPATRKSNGFRVCLEMVFRVR